MVQLAGQSLADPVCARTSSGRADVIVLSPGSKEGLVAGSSPIGDRQNRRTPGGVVTAGVDPGRGVPVAALRVSR